MLVTCPPSRSRAFTLLELLVVMIVVAVLSIAAIPAVNSSGTQRARMAGTQLLRDLTFARQRAQSTGIRTWVVFSLSLETYSVLAESGVGAGRASAATLTDPATNSPFLVYLNRNDTVGVDLVSTTLTNTEVGFDALGRPINAAGTVLTASNTVTLTGPCTITIAGNTGYITAALP